MSTKCNSDKKSLEQTGYFPVPGAYLYTVLHGVVDPVARVLLVGPFAWERHFSYIPWVRWARYLAARRIECLRYDYRGIGESTGAFEDLGFENWVEDVGLLAAWLKGRSPQLPLMLHGLELGALLANKTFETGIGDALLMWAPPASAQQALRATLLRRVSMEHAFKQKDERKSLSDYIRRLESGDVIEVEGYNWSRSLWQDSFNLEMPAATLVESSAASASKRPVRIVKLDKQAVPLIKGTSVGFEAVSKDFSDLFADNFEWIAKELAFAGGAIVKKAIETRELITVTVGGISLRGTHHKTQHSPQARAGKRGCVGVLFLNHGFLPRSAAGDSAVYWADSLAKSGHPCFRFDLPGFGDSDGDVPVQIIDFVNAGRYAPVINATVKDLVGRFGLAGIVIVGHCTGAVSALYTAAIARECRGLVLTDPYFFLLPERTKIRDELSRWTWWSKLGYLLWTSSAFYYLKQIRLLLRRTELPENANLPLLRCWNRLSSAGMPILVLKAPGFKTRGIRPRIGEFDYLGYLQEMSDRSSRIDIQFVEGANHSFADVLGKAAVLQHTERWLSAHFPTTSEGLNLSTSSFVHQDAVDSARF